MKVHINEKRVLGKRDKMIYGHFIEHFHRQIYGGVYEPDSPMADEDGFRQDVLEVMRKIQVPVLRWPGGCFVSSYHWKEAVGKISMMPSNPENLPELSQQILSDLENCGTFAQCWDVRLDPSTNEVYRKELANLGMGESTPEDFCKRMDEAVAQYAPDYFDIE